MVDVLNFIFSDFLHFVGVLILMTVPLSIAAAVFAEVLEAIRKDK